MMINHRQICLRAETKKAPTHNKSDYLDLINWVGHLIKNLEMKIIIGPEFYYVNSTGNEGWTGGCHIETSHLSMHWWENPSRDWLSLASPGASLLQFDLYTCGKFGSKQVNIVLSSIQTFEPVYVEYMIINREKNFLIEKTESVYC